MSLKCAWAIEQMERLAPPEAACEWDNVGLLIGSGAWVVRRILVALDLTYEVAIEAVNLNADMIITHHPFIFRQELNRITDESPLGEMIILLIKHNISVFAAHTNLDAAEGGTNDVLFEKLGLVDKGYMDIETGIGRTGVLPEAAKLSDFSEAVKRVLGLQAIRVTGDLGKSIKRVCLCTGNGSDDKYYSLAKNADSDVYLTGDIKYHDAQLAREMGLALIDITHYASEVLVVDKLCSYLRVAAERDAAEVDIIASLSGGPAWRES